MAQGKIVGNLSSFKINGIIEEYTVAAGGNVNAGDFVKFVNEYGTDTQLSTQQDSGYQTSAVALNENKVFVTHSFSSSSYYQMYGIVCTINGTTITVGNETQLIYLYSSSITISTIALNENKVFIAYGRDSNKYLYGIVCTINGTNITKGTDTQLSNTRYSGNTISAVTLNENKVFIAHSSDTYLYGIVCTINGTTITTDTDIQLNSTQNSGNMISAVTLNENKVFIIYHTSSSGNYQMYGIVCTINGTTITKGTDIQLSTYQSLRAESVVALNENKVFIVYSKSSGNYQMYGIICTINGTSITKGTETQLNNDSDSGSVISAVALNENKVFIAYLKKVTISSYNYYYLHEMICTINGTSIIINIDIELSTNIELVGSISAMALNENKIFINYAVGSYNSKSHGISGNVNLINKFTSLSDMWGIAKTSATAGNKAQVYVPN